MKGLVILGSILLLLILYIWFEQKEGWEDLQQAIQDTTSPIANTVNPLKNPMAPIGVSVAEGDAIRSSFRAGFNLSELQKNSDGTLSVAEPTTKVEARVDDETSFLGLVKFCAERGKDGNPFSDPRFAANCGMCMTKGKLITGETFTSPTGIYITSEDKSKALRLQKEKGHMFPRVLPSLTSAQCAGASIGNDAAPVIALTEQDYTLYKNRADCSKATTVGDGCAQCYGTSSYTFVGKAPPVQALSLFLQGKGDVTVTYKNTAVTKAPVQLSMSSTSEIELGRVPEGEQITIQVKQGTTSDGPLVSGFFRSPLPTGKQFQLPLEQLDVQDMEAAAAARRVGFQYNTSYGGRLSILRPAAGKNSMTLLVTLPFTFIEPDQLAAYDCDSAPLMSLPASAERFSKDPCSKGSPGAYSEDCLRERIMESGCSVTGDAYKDPKAAAGSLSISAFVDKIVRYANMKEIDREAMIQCIGPTAVKSIETPCDTFLGVKGANPSSLQSCLSFLYANESEKTAVGSAYPTVLGKQYTSMGAKGNVQYCTSAGTLNPATSKELEGIFNTGYKNKKGVDAVKEYLSDVFTRATDDSLSPLTEDSKGGRANAIAKCFRTLRPFPEGGIRGAVSYPKNYTLPYQTQAIQVLGAIGMEPWAGAWGIRANSIGDAGAKWIWRPLGGIGWLFSGLTAAANEPSWAEYTYLTTFTNPRSEPMQILLHCIVDNKGKVLLNNKEVGATGGYTKLNLTVPPGQNLFEFPSSNQGGPAGICISAQELPRMNVLFHTDETWKMKV